MESLRKIGAELVLDYVKKEAGELLEMFYEENKTKNSGKVK